MSFYKFMRASMGVPGNDQVNSPLTGLAGKTVIGLLKIAFILFILGALVFMFRVIVGILIAGLFFLGSVACLSFAIKVGLFQQKLKQQSGTHVQIDPDDVIDV